MSMKSVCVLACAMLAAGCCRGAVADEAPAGDEAQHVVDEVVRRAGSGEADGLGEWTRELLGRALERAGGQPPIGAAPGPLPAETHAAELRTGLAGRADTGEVLVFTSLAMPSASWRAWAAQASAVGAPLVLRGVLPDGLAATAKRLRARLGGAHTGIAIDPRLFRLFAVERVPAVVVVPGGVAPCRSRGCADDPPPPHDRIAGNIGLAAALEAIAAEGRVARDAARGALERLREKRP